MVNWDLSKIIAGQYGNVSMPFGLVEAGLRTNRTKVLDEVRWRYRENPPALRAAALSTRRRQDSLLSGSSGSRSTPSTSMH